MRLRSLLLKLGLTGAISMAVAPIFITRLQAQELPNQVLPSPSTMQFQKYGDYPVSQYTGIPDIKIPIYTIQAGDITVPIYFSFHSSGLNMDEDYNYIGPGWALQTGGMMSRVINGMPDEYYNNMQFPDYSSNYQSNYYPMHDTFTYWTSDHDFDIFSYNFLNKSGKFIPYAWGVLHANDPVPPEYDAFLLRDDNIKVEVGFVTDENGISYGFGGEGKEEYQQFQAPTKLAMGAVSTWHLSGIASSKFPGIGVSYEYQNGYTYTPPSTSWIIDDGYYRNGDTNENEDLAYLFPYSYPLGNFRVQSFSDRSYYTLVPKRINFPTGYLLFTLNSTKNLTKIELFDKDNALLRTVEIDADNFSVGLRRVKAIITKDAQGNEQERYSFNYYNENVSTLSQGKDYWGFYNGTSTGGDFVPSISNFPLIYRGSYYNEGGRFITFGGGADREPNAYAAKTYMLQKITYPTGGSTIFDYEANTSTTRELGGLRIKNISSYDRSGALALSKNYAYTPGNTEVPINTSLFKEDKLVVASFYDGRRRTISENASVPLSPKGAPMGYPIVTETEGQTTTTYHFDDQPAYQYDALDFPVNYVKEESSPLYRRFAHHYKPWNFGDLLLKEVSGPGFYKKETYGYDTFIKQTVTDLIMHQHADVMPTTPTEDEQYWHTLVLGSIYNFAKRYHYSGVKRLVSKSYWEGDAFMGTGIGNEEVYNYDDVSHPMQMTSKLSLNSKGESIKTEFKYPYNYPGVVNDELVRFNRIGEPIEQVQKNVTKGNQELSHVKMEYNFYNPGSSPFNTLGNVHLKEIKKSVAGNALETEANAERYDTNGHILQQRGRDGIVVSYIFGYKNNFPVARIMGADYNTAIALVNSTLINDSYQSMSDTDMRAHLSALRTGLPNAQVTIFTYKIGVGMTSETDPKGKTILYEYDNFQRLLAIKDQQGKVVKAYSYKLKH